MWNIFDFFVAQAFKLGQLRISYYQKNNIQNIFKFLFVFFVGENYWESYQFFSNYIFHN